MELYSIHVTAPHGLFDIGLEGSAVRSEDLGGVYGSGIAIIAHRKAGEWKGR